MTTRQKSDPTREEIDEFIASHFEREIAANESSELFQRDKERAIHWFSTNWNTGPGSNLHDVLGSSGYKPKANEGSPDNDDLIDIGLSADIYDAMELHFFASEPLSEMALDILANESFILMEEEGEL